MSDNAATGASANAAGAGSAGYFGAAWFSTAGTSFSTLDFLIREVLAGKAFAGLAKVLGVTGGGIGAPPIVSVQPLVADIEGLGNLVPHGPVYAVPCFRLQSGVAAVILDPVAGDIGDVIVCHRDHSNVKATGALAGPGSRRQNSWADGCYFGSFLGPVPTTFLAMDQDGNATLTTTATAVVNTPNAVLQNPGGTLLLQLHDLPVTGPPPNPDQVWRDGTGPTTLNIAAT